jgi:hypothetical protein
VNDISDDKAPALLQLFRENDGTYGPFFEWAAARQNDSAETTVDTVKRKGRLDHGQAIALLKGLDAAGVGRLIVGRRGQKTRIEWYFSLRSIGSAAMGLSGLTEIDGDSDEVAHDDELLDGPDLTEHNFVLRPDLRVTFDLPVDLTAQEAERLAAFIRTLPFV